MHLLIMNFRVKKSMEKISQKKTTLMFEYYNLLDHMLQIFRVDIQQGNSKILQFLPQVLTFWFLEDSYTEFGKRYIRNFKGLHIIYFMGLNQQDGDIWHFLQRKIILKTKLLFYYYNLMVHLIVGYQINYLFGNLEFVRDEYNFRRFCQESFKIFQKFVNENAV